MKTMLELSKWGFVFVAVFVFVALSCGAAEHPAEHAAEHPQAGKAKSEITKESLAKAIENYVAEDAKLKGGYFLVYDDKQGKALVLTLDKVHKDKLANVSKNVYFACADFKMVEEVGDSSETHMYDLDIFMEGTGARLKPTEITIHKQDGKERYTWQEEDGIWRRTPVPNE